MTVNVYCRSCGLPIQWAITVNEKRMPVDRDPSEDGNVAIRVDERGNVRATVLRKGDKPRPGEQLFTSHFQTCKYAGAHRNARR